MSAPPPSPPTHSHVPFFTISGFQECSWYRRALCVAQDYVQSQAGAGSDSGGGGEGGRYTGPQMAAQTIDRQHFRHHLLSVRSSGIDIGDHYSCPLILEGQCRAADDGSVSECRPVSMVGGYSDFAKALQDRFGFVSQRCGKLPTTVGGHC